MARADTHLREAQALANRLDRAGDKRAAEVIRALSRTYVASRSTNQVLHRENMQLRGGTLAQAGGVSS